MKMNVEWQERVASALAYSSEPARDQHEALVVCDHPRIVISTASGLTPKVTASCRFASAIVKTPPGATSRAGRSAGGGSSWGIG
jgi:hypothetical protein